MKHGQRICQHRQRKIMAPQAERDGTDHQSRQASNRGAQRNSDPRRDIGTNQQQRRRKGAKSEERTVAERNQTRIAGQHVPGQSHDRPDRDQRQHELVI